MPAKNSLALFIWIFLQDNVSPSALYAMKSKYGAASEANVNTKFFVSSVVNGLPVVSNEIQNELVTGPRASLDPTIFGWHFKNEKDLTANLPHMLNRIMGPQVFRFHLLYRS
jgi:hypothetical protein